MYVSSQLSVSVAAYVPVLVTILSSVTPPEALTCRSVKLVPAERVPLSGLPHPKSNSFAETVVIFPLVTALVAFVTDACGLQASLSRGLEVSAPLYSWIINLTEPTVDVLKCTVTSSFPPMMFLA